LTEPYQLTTVSDDPSCDAARCPRCRYPLIGLPPAHQCPDCAFAFDAQTLVWRVAGFAAVYRSALLLNRLGEAGLMVALVATTVYLASAPIPAASAFVILAIGAILLYGTLRYRHLWVQGLTLGLTPEGIYLANTVWIDTSAVRWRGVIPWREIADVYWNGTSGYVNIRTEDRVMRIGGIFDTMSEVEVFVRAAQKRLTEYADAYRHTDAP